MSGQRRQRRLLACHDCNIDTSNSTGIGHYYMAWDEVWRQAKQGERVRFLCLDCLEARLGRPLRSTDFMITPSEMDQRMWSADGEHTVLPERERQRWLDYWRAVPRHSRISRMTAGRRERRAGERRRRRCQMIGPDAGWETGMQRVGRKEMALRLRQKGPAAAADYAARFERSANEWLVYQGLEPAFMFKAIPLPILS